MHRQYPLLTEPTGAAYVALLRALARFCQHAMLVVRPTIPLSPYGQQVLQELQHDIVAQEKRQAWPGTQLLDGYATVYLIRLTDAALETLCRRARRLYEWQQPLLPEDLCLLRDESQPMLVTISHERDAYLLLTEDERRELLSACEAIANLWRII